MSGGSLEHMINGSSVISMNAVTITNEGGQSVGPGVIVTSINGDGAGSWSCVDMVTDSTGSVYVPLTGTLTA